MKTCFYKFSNLVPKLVIEKLCKLHAVESVFTLVVISILEIFQYVKTCLWWSSFPVTLNSVTVTDLDYINGRGGVH